MPFSNPFPIFSITLCNPIGVPKEFSMQDGGFFDVEMLKELAKLLLFNKYSFCLLIEIMIF